MKRLGIAIVATAVLLTLPGGAAAQSTLDANCPPLGGDSLVNHGDDRYAHVVTPLATGKVTSAEVRLTRNPGDEAGDYILRISDLVAGVPTGSVMGTAVIPDASVPEGSVNAPSLGTFALPVPVVAGQPYALILTRPAATGPQGLRFQVRGVLPSDACAGTLFHSSGGGPFVDQGNNMVFSTFVDPAPTVAITKHPHKKSRRRKARFNFGSNEAGARFECRLDKGAFKPCARTHVFKKLKRRRHKLEVHAVDQVGNISAPASFGWKVKKALGP